MEGWGGECSWFASYFACFVCCWLTTLTPVQTPTPDHSTAPTGLLGQTFFAREPVPSGELSIQRLTDNLRGYIIPDSRFFEEKAIRWYSDLLFGPDRVDD